MARRKTPTANGGAIVPFESVSSELTQFKGYEQQIARQRASTPAAGGMPTIGANQGVFTLIGGGRVESFDAVALCALRANAWWPGGYMQGDSDPPECASIASLGEHENALAPIDGYDKQAETCAQCPHNVRPRKSCRNGLRVALVSTDALQSVKAAEEATIVQLRISSTGIAPWGIVAESLAERNVPLFGGVLRFVNQKPSADATHYTTFAHTIGAVADEKIVAVLSKRVSEAEKLLIRAAQPIPKIADGEADAAPAPRRRVSSSPGQTSKKAPRKRKLA